MHYQFKLIILTLIVFFIPFQIIAQHLQPNILWIITDDERPDALSCVNRAVNGSADNEYGFVFSPNFDQLAKEGTLFLNAYCNSPACAPSRASMITGQYPSHNGIYGFENTHLLSISKPVVPQVLSNAGYQTALFGKFDVRISKYEAGGKMSDPGFYQNRVDMMADIANIGLGDWSTKPKGHESYYFPNGVTKILRTYPITKQDSVTKTQIDQELHLLRAYTRGSLPDIIYGGISPQPADKAMDAEVINEFKSFLNHRNQPYNSKSGKPLQGVAAEKPLMVDIGIHAPHTPVIVPKEFGEIFKNKVYKLPAFDKNELKNMPAQMVRFYDSVKVDGLKYDEKQQMMRDYYAFSAYADYEVGNAVKAFKEYCKSVGREYVILIAVGDNGWHLGEHGMSTKFSPYVQSNQQAIIAVSSDKKKFPAGKVVNDFVEYVDFAPTIYSAAGIDVKKPEYKFLDGRDLATIAQGQVMKRQYVLGEINHLFGPRAFIRTKDFSFSMRVRPYDDKITNPLLKDMHWCLDAPEKDVDMGLYDLRNDKHELKNVAYQKKYHQLALWFRKKLGEIVMGDNRLQANWDKADEFKLSQFAVGSDDKKTNIPLAIIPKIAN